MVSGPPNVSSVLAACGSLTSGCVTTDVGAAVGRAAGSGSPDGCRDGSGQTTHCSLAFRQLRWSWRVKLELEKGFLI